MTVSFRLLRAAALIELVSLVVLLVNVATVHWPPVATLLGPLHGCAYLMVIGLAPDRRRRLTALLPGVGGLLVVTSLSG